MDQIIPFAQEDDITVVLPTGNDGMIEASLDEFTPQNLGTQDNALITVGGVEKAAATYASPALHLTDAGSEACTVNRCSQTILCNDGAWETASEQEKTTIEKRLAQMSDNVCLPSLQAHETRGGQDVEQATPLMRPPPCVAKDTPDNFELVMDPESGHASISGSVLSPVIDAHKAVRTE